MWTLYSKRTDHYIPIKTIASFKRMRQYSEYGYQWLVDTLRKSESLEVDPSGELVRRTTEPKETTIADAFERSVYAVRTRLYCACSYHSNSYDCRILICPSTHRKASTTKLRTCRSALNGSLKTTVISTPYACEENRIAKNSKVPCSVNLSRWRVSSRSSMLIRNLPGKARSF